MPPIIAPPTKAKRGADKEPVTNPIGTDNKAVGIPSNKATGSKTTPPTIAIIAIPIAINGRKAVIKLTISEINVASGEISEIIPEKIVE